MLNLTKLLDPNEREVKRHSSVAAAVNELEPELQALDDAGLRARSDELRQRARDGHDLDEGKIAEMKTGEGKTLVASLALYLNALAGEGVHLVTVNDYLARRDAGW